MNSHSIFTPVLLRREVNIQVSLEFEYTDMCLILCCKAQANTFIDLIMGQILEKALLPHMKSPTDCVDIIHSSASYYKPDSSPLSHTDHANTRVICWSEQKSLESLVLLKLHRPVTVMVHLERQESPEFPSCACWARVCQHHAISKKSPYAYYNASISSFTLRSKVRGSSHESEKQS